MLPVLAQQDTDALVQRGPVGLMCEEGQEIGPEGGHLGTGLTFALGRKEAWWSLLGPQESETGPPRGSSSGHLHIRPGSHPQVTLCAKLN